MAPGTDLHAYTAIRADLTPILETTLFIELPAGHAPVHGPLPVPGDGSGRARFGTLETGLAETFCAQVDRLVRDKGHVRLYRKKPNPGTISVGDEIALAAQFP